MSEFQLSRNIAPKRKRAPFEFRKRRRHNKPMIESIFGPMFSGKTSELMRKIKRHQLAQKKCLVINYFADNRYSKSSSVVSHDNLSIPALKVRALKEISDEQVEHVQVIAIDEGQFFPDLLDKAENWANRGKVVIVAALDCTFQKRPFNRVTDLLAISEKVTKLSAVCMDCGQDASFTKRISSEGKVEVIGGLDKYKPVCRRCFHEESEPVTPKKTLKKLKENVSPFSVTTEASCKTK